MGHEFTGDVRNVSGSQLTPRGGECVHGRRVKEVDHTT